MLFVIETKDKPDGLDMRVDTRPAHIDYLKSLGDVLVLAGPFLDDDGNPCGSMVVIRAHSKQEAEEIAANDPYSRAGLFIKSDIRPWTWSVNKPEGLVE